LDGAVMIDTDEKRLTELETIVWDFPSLINTRFERFDAETDANRIALADNTARLVQVERRLNALTTDMRDMRAGLTRHMLEQSRQMTAVVAKVDGFGERIDGLESRMDKFESRMERLESRMEGLEAIVVTRMDKLELGQQAIMDSLQKVLTRLPG
jgi:septation ring formation regulator EzrA